MSMTNDQMSEKLKKWHPTWNVEHWTTRQVAAVYRKEANKMARNAVAMLAGFVAAKISTMPNDPSSQVLSTNSLPPFSASSSVACSETTNNRGEKDESPKQLLLFSSDDETI